jgi:hypothetical protein
MNRLIAATFALAVGCATPGSGVRVVPPEVHIVDLELLESGVEQRFRVTPARGEPLTISVAVGVRFDLALNEQPFARGSRPTEDRPASRRRYPHGRCDRLDVRPRSPGAERTGRELFDLMH